MWRCEACYAETVAASVCSGERERMRLAGGSSGEPGAEVDMLANDGREIAVRGASLTLLMKLAFVKDEKTCRDSEDGLNSI